QANDLLGKADDLTNMYSAGTDQKALKKIDHIVVIYEENHSFDNLYGGWEKVNGIGDPGYDAHAAAVDQSGVPLSCPPPLDGNPRVPPLVSTCTATDKNGATSQSHFVNAPFEIDDSIEATDRTCPPPAAQFSATTNGVLKDSTAIPLQTNVAGAATGPAE